MVNAEGWFRRYRRAVNARRQLLAEAEALRAELELVAQERDSLRARLRQVEARGAPLVQIVCSVPGCYSPPSHGPDDLAVVCGEHSGGWPAETR